MLGRGELICLSVCHVHVSAGVGGGLLEGVGD